ncbi:MAG: DNA polymerase III subunit delta [Polyangiaceae bacterium]|nr:DNA polymerase III subunit delta [Polyangiaceae bacterium]MCW5790481.1 DNA polymerase III subunit delta [Polyangiaceae bacterium]
MTPEEALAEAQAGSLRPVYLVHGSERFLHDGVLRALRDAATLGGIPGMNDDQLTAGEASVEAALGAARTLPMMGARRLVLVRHIDRWEPRGDAPKAKGKGAQALDQLTDYAEDPVSTTVLVLSSATLDKRRRLFILAQKQGFLVECTPPKAQELPSWVAGAIKRRGHAAAPGVAELIAQIGGTDLAQLDDAVERVCLYAGPGERITEAMVAECIVRVTSQTGFDLVDQVARRDVGRCLSALSDVFDPNGAPALVGLLAWSARQLLAFDSARKSGASPADAAKAAGAPPFKARDLEAQLRRVSTAELERWLETLAGVDMAIKGGSARPPLAVFEAALLELCAQRRP